MGNLFGAILQAVTTIADPSSAAVDQNFDSAVSLESARPAYNFKAPQNLRKFAQKYRAYFDNSIIQVGYCIDDYKRYRGDKASDPRGCSADDVNKTYSMDATLSHIKPHLPAEYSSIDAAMLAAQSGNDRFKDYKAIQAELSNELGKLDDARDSYWELKKRQKEYEERSRAKHKAAVAERMAARKRLQTQRANAPKRPAYLRSGAPVCASAYATMKAAAIDKTGNPYAQFPDGCKVSHSKMKLDNAYSHSYNGVYTIDVGNGRAYTIGRYVQFID